MTDDLIALARQYNLPAGTHYANCEADHPFCLLFRMADEIERLRQRLAEDERDAARYRWLKKSNPVMIHAIAWGVAEARKFDDVDTAIDAAISADSATRLENERE